MHAPNPLARPPGEPRGPESTRRIERSALDSARRSELAALLQHVLEHADRLVAVLVGEVEDLLQRDPDVRNVLLDVAALLELGAQALALPDVGAELASALLQPELDLLRDLVVRRDRLL